MIPSALSVLPLLLGIVSAQTCTTTLTPSHPAPSVASGYEARLVATGLSAPRGIVFDPAGRLLVVQQNVGIRALTLRDDGGSCVTVASSAVVVADTTLNHGIDVGVSNGALTLFVSSSNNVYAWAYNNATGAISGSSTTLVTGMDNTDHVTRTLLLSKNVPNTIIVSRGSNDNMDAGCSTLSNGRCMVKTFSTTATSQNYGTAGKVLGWGLRNSVGVTEHPITGAVFSVENSADNLVRDGTDIHTDNPGEEMNYLGFANKTVTPGQEPNFGYPTCFAAWSTNIPANSNIRVGTQFAQSSSDDATCSTRTAPTLTFQAHMAPLDIKLERSGANAWVSFHGSWNRQPPVGYFLARVAFGANGQPTQPSTSTTAAIPILSPANVNNCPSACARPVGLAFDSKGRLFMSSDATGSIWIITKSGGGGIST